MRGSCPQCKGLHVVKNGRNRQGKQIYRCMSCKRCFVLNPERGITPEVKAIIIRLIEEDIPTSVIARATGVSRSSVYEHRKKR